MRICRRIDYPVEQVLLDSAPVTGHAFAADAFINHGAAVERDLFRPGMPYVVAAAGLGATFSAWCFTIEQELNKAEQS